MSTMFEVLPATDRVPTFREVVESARLHAEPFFSEFGLGTVPEMMFSLLTNRSHEVREVASDAPFLWDSGTSYVWFTVPGTEGGTDAKCQSVTEFDREFWLEEILTNPRAAALANRISSGLKIGRYWSFRRSAGQPAVINVMYGFLAAGLADLTAGIVHSTDSAWDYNLLPARPEEFSRNYFRSSRMSKAEFGDWAHQCIESLRGHSAAT